MQDKCVDVDCLDPQTNIRIGAHYLRSLLNSTADQNVLAVIGSWNGWFVGMTYEDATNARYGDCCYCQRNLD